MKILKSTLIALILLVTGNVFSQSGLTNLDFETTSSFIGYGCATPTPFPTGFNRSQATTNGFGWPVQYTLSTTAQSGSKYISIGNVNTCGHVDLQPISFGIFGGNTPGSGSPYTNKPTSLCGYYRAQGIQTAGDSVYALVYLTKNGALIGKGKWSSGSNKSTWTAFCANITYSSSVTPDTIRIRFTPSGFLAASSSSATSQTIYFDIDNVSLTTSSGISEASELSANLSFYPNPANDKLTINNDNNETLTAEIYNCIGQLERSVHIREGKNIINTHDLNSGIYFVSVKNKEKVISNTKVIITH